MQALSSVMKGYFALPGWTSTKGKIALDWIRWIALSGMMIDHFGSVVMQGTVYDDLTGLIGFAQPLIAFGIVWGCELTKDWKRYLWRIVLLALLSEIPYQLSGVSHQGSMSEIWGLALGVIACILENTRKGLGLFAVLLSFLCPWSGLLTLMCWLAKVTKGRELEYFIIVSAFTLCVLRITPDWTIISWVVAPILIILVRFFELPKIPRNKWVIYSVYPAHLVGLAIINKLIMGA